MHALPANEFPGSCVGECSNDRSVVASRSYVRILYASPRTLIKQSIEEPP